MITGAQIRAARALMNWTATEAAQRIGSTRQTVQRLEQQIGIPATKAQTLLDLKRTFEAAGIEFIGSPEEGPGVRLWPKKKKVRP